METMDPAAAEAKYKKRDDTSNLLGQKMLQGWTLLGVTCPMEECYTPLVRSKQGKTYCVSCEQYYLTEEEAKKQKEEEEAKKSKEQQEQQEREEQEEEERNRRIAQQFRLEEQAKRAREMQELEQAQGRRAAATSSGPAKRKSEDVAAERVVEDSAVSAARRQTLAALYQKIDQLTSSLTPHDHSERLVSVAKAIHELAQAAQTIAPQ